NGGDGNDQIRLNDVTIGRTRGGDGDDFIAIQGGENQAVWGEGGNDFIRLTDVPKAAIDGGDGVDTVDYQFNVNPGGLNLETGVNTGAATNHTLVSIEHFLLTDHNDSFLGSSRDECVHANGGNARLEGQGGNDVLYGEAGDDVLNGGPGHDVLVGGLGTDRFLFD